MNVHEHQAKALLATHGVRVPEGRLARSVEEAVASARELGGEGWAVKAQVHAGGRGKAGGIQLALSLDEVEAAAADILGRNLVTEQTTAAGELVRAVLVERIEPVERELYVALTIDRSRQSITVVASESGGVGVEDAARDGDGHVLTERIDIGVGLAPFAARALAVRLGLGGKHLRQAVELLGGLFATFAETEALQLEINPLAVTVDGTLVALDAKLVVDDNALDRLPDVAALRDVDAEDPKEIDAAAHGLNYVALDGDVGCIVNGAGLAMATMDVISLRGGRPANFLDVGGGATPEKVANAFRIVLGDPNVRAILVNIFAGINRCDWIAEGILKAAAEQEIDVPIIARLAGTNEEEGRRILAESGLELVAAEDLGEAAALAIAAAELAKEAA